jgi:hypothetical protein
MKRFLPPGLMIFAGILGLAPYAGLAEQDVTKAPRKVDLREAILRKFLKANHCPDQEYAELLIAEADTYGLDWRLLPSLALVETGGGRTAKGNNLFGWANGKMSFTTIGEAIHQVASALSGGRAYRGKSLDDILLTYNSERPDYRAMVLDIMRQISPRQQVAAAD